MAEDFVLPSEKLPIAYAASSSEAVPGSKSFEDVCSVCLEPFNADDPATVTNCKHEYHLQCILEWSQRSKECPLCWQFLVLEDPACQELLAAVDSERSMRSKHVDHHINEDHDDAPDAVDTDFEERIMRQFAVIASRARYVSRRARQMSLGIGPSQILPSVPTADVSDVQQIYGSLEEWQNSRYGLLEDHSPTSGTQSAVIYQTLPTAPVTESDIVNSRDGSVKTAHPSSGSPQRPSASELHTFSETVKSRFSAASARYKESISRSTRGFKEKLLARNNSVKELGRGVQREMSAGIAGVAKMFERLDLSSKRAAASVPLSSHIGGTRNASSKGKDMQESLAAESLHGNMREATHCTVLDTPSFASKVSLTQSGT